MDWDNNIGFHPERYGLEVIGWLHEPGMSYEFNEFCIWKHDDGSIYWASDSGCSCPSPFEWANSLDSLNKVESFSDLEDGVQAWLSGIILSEESGSSWYPSQSQVDLLRCNAVELLAKVASYV